jgi:hypothetical protein
MAEKGRDGSQLDCSHLLFGIVRAAVEYPEEGFFVETLNFRF